MIAEQIVEEAIKGKTHHSATGFQHTFLPQLIQDVLRLFLIVPLRDQFPAECIPLNHLGQITADWLPRRGRQQLNHSLDHGLAQSRCAQGLSIRTPIKQNARLIVLHDVVIALDLGTRGHGGSTSQDVQNERDSTQISKVII